MRDQSGVGENNSEHTECFLCSTLWAACAPWSTLRYVCNGSIVIPIPHVAAVTELDMPFGTSSSVIFRPALIHNTNKSKAGVRRVGMAGGSHLPAWPGKQLYLKILSCERWGNWGLEKQRDLSEMRRMFRKLYESDPGFLTFHLVLKEKGKNQEIVMRKCNK